MNPQYIDIIIFGAVAVFLIFRLVRSLGTRPDGKENIDSDNEEMQIGAERKSIIIDITDKLPTPDNIEQSKIVLADEKGDLKSVFYKMYHINHSFHPDNFLEGAKAAFAMIIEAFSKDDEETLKMLVSDKVFSRFKKALDTYKEKGEKLEQTLIGFKDVKIENASLEGNNASIAVRFETEQAMVVKDKEGKVIEGDSVMISSVSDVWTFVKNLKDSTPNWTLTDVKAG